MCAIDGLPCGKASGNALAWRFLRLDKQVISEISFLRDAEAEIHALAQARKNAETDKVDKVNVREATTVATARSADGESESHRVAQAREEWESRAYRRQSSQTG